MIKIADFNPIKDVLMFRKGLIAIHFLINDIGKSDCIIDSLFDGMEKSIDELLSHLNDIFENEEVVIKDKAWQKLMPKINAMVSCETDKLRKEQENDKSC